MFKKFLFSILSLAIVLGVYNAYAFLGKQTNSIFQLSASYSGLTVVSENDFNDTIQIQATSSPNTTLYIEGNFDSTGWQAISPVSTVTTNALGIANATATYKWSPAKLAQAYPGTYRYVATFRATDQSTNAQASSGDYSATVSYAIISLTNNQSISNNGTVTRGTNVTFTCTNSSEMYYGPSGNWPTGASLVDSEYAGASQSDYTLNYSTTLNSVGNYTLQCANIGGNNTIQTLNFSVIENTSCPAGQVYKNGACRDTFNITNINSSPNTAAADTTFTWTSTADSCNVYTGDKVTRLNPQASIKSGSNWSAVVPSANMPSSAGTYGYYIKCATNSGSNIYPNASLEADPTDDHAGWKSYSAAIGDASATEFTITNISSSPNSTNTANTFTWTSDADTSCALYEYGDGYLYYPGGPVKIVDASRSGNTWTAVLPSNRAPSSAANVAYYVGCYSASRIASESNGVTRDYYDGHKGWKDYTAPYTVAAGSTFDITNISSSPNMTNTANTFTWISNADTCNVYTNDKATRLNPSASTKSGNSFSATVPANNMPINAGNYGYYIKCYSATLNPSSNLEADSVDPTHTGWKGYSVTVSSADSETFNITNVNSAPNEISQDTTFSWWSDAGGTYCWVYNYDKSEVLGSAPYGTTNWSTIIPANKMPSTAGTYGYYVACYDTNKHPDPSLEETTFTDAGGTYYYGWRQYSVYIAEPTCSGGQVYQNGACTCPVGEELRNGICTSVDYFDIYNFDATPKETGTDNTFSWWSEANLCDIYSYEWDASGGHPGSKLNPSASNRSGQDFSALVPAANMPTTAGNYGYYVRCESTDESYESAPGARASWEDDPYVAWRYFSVNLTEGMPACPSGQIRSTPTGTCHTPCPSGYPWNESAGTCGNPNPTCNWADPATKTNVQCNVPYVCENGNAPELRVYYKDGHYDVVNPPTNPFTWDTAQYQYQFYCDDDNLIPVAPLRKTYTHFLTFNISASNVQKGTKINLNWSVEDPNTTCKIEGVSIKNPNQLVFNSKSDGRLDAKISTSTGSVQTSSRDLATGDYNSIIGQYWQVDQSTRFTASCTDNGTYKPGYYQLVRDIYVTGEEER